MTTKSYVPRRGRVLMPHICCRQASEAIKWYCDVFGARLSWDPYVDADGRVGLAELEIDGALFMLSDGFPDAGVDAPAVDRLPTYALTLYLPDVDRTVAAAEQAGATVLRPPADRFYGARTATILDPYGVSWMLGTQLREPADEEFDAARSQFAGG